MLQSKEEWDETLASFPNAHLLQTGEWGELKSHFGWTVIRFSTEKASAQVLLRRLPLGFHVAYLPKGPLGAPDIEFWNELAQECRRRKTVFLKVEPDVWEDSAEMPENLLPLDATHSSSIQPIQTIVLDISGGREAVLDRMKQKTRYNIHLAEKKGVTVEPWRDFPAFGQMMNTTALRDGFGVHTTRYYELAFNVFSKQGRCELFCARYENKPLAAVMVFRNGNRAWYLYGASTNEERNRMPAYLVQWQAICWAMDQGCTEYDLYGIPDASEMILEENFTHRSDGLWGVYRFKRGFGGRIKRSFGAVDQIFLPHLYSAYHFAQRMRKRTGGLG